MKGYELKERFNLNFNGCDNASTEIIRENVGDLFWKYNPFEEWNTGAMGEGYKFRRVFLIYGNRKVEVKPKYYHHDNSGTEDREDGETIREKIKENGIPSQVLIFEHEDWSWEGMGSGKTEKSYLLIIEKPTEEEIKKLRRKVEDVLRKSNYLKILEVAYDLNII